MSWFQRLKQVFSGKRKAEDDDQDATAVEGRSAAARRRASAEREAVGWQLQKRGDLEGAMAAFSKAIALYPPDPKAFYGRGVTNCMLGRYMPAIDDLSRAIELAHRFPAALTERGLAYVDDGSVERGILDYDAAIALDPSYATAHENKGSALCLLGRFSEAIPLLDLALRLNPRNPNPLYNRSVAHEMLGDARAALRDLESYLASGVAGPLVAKAKARMQELRAQVEIEPEPPGSILEHLWTEIVLARPGQMVSELIEEIRARGAFFVIMDREEGRRAVLPVYGKGGLRHRLTDIADHIGERILSLRLEQIHDLWTDCVPVAPTADAELIVQRLRESNGHTLVQDGERMLGVVSGGFGYHYPFGPTDIFGPESVFERNAGVESSRRCSSCDTMFGYFEPVVRDGMLEDYACERCHASPIPSWIEERMRPGAWSRSGFLGEQERLEDAMTSDDQTLQRLGLSHGQIADALGHLLDAASAAYEERISEATDRFMDSMAAAGKRSVDGEALLPLRPSLDEIEQLLRRSALPPPDVGVSIQGFQVFLQVYLGYQECPWTVLRRPWNDEAPPMPIAVREKNKYIALMAVTGCRLPCRAGLMYHHGDRDFLVVRRDTGEYLRGAGLMVHLIRDHHFFEGEQSRYRLDPEQAARVLGLLDAGR